MLLYEHSEEGMSQGLGLMKGKVVKKTPINIDQFKVPNVGWLNVERTKKSSLFNNIKKEDSIFYFANLYAVKNEDNTCVTSIYNFDDNYVASSKRQYLLYTISSREKWKNRV